MDALLSPLVAIVKGWKEWGTVLQIWAILTLGFYNWLWRGVWRDEKTRKAINGWLGQDRVFTRYQRSLGRVLDQLDHWLSVPEINANRAPLSRAFSRGLIQTTMLWAVVYPFTLFLLQWLFGSALTLGGITLTSAPETEQILFVMVWISVVAGVLVAMRIALHVSFLCYLISFLAALGSSIAGPWLANQINTPLPDIVEILGMVAVVVVFTATAGLAGTTAITIAFSSTVANMELVIGAIVGALVIVVLGAAVLEVRVKRRSSSSLDSIGYILLLLSGLAALAQFIPETALPATNERSALLFLGFFPVLNALADFASIGATRYFLRRGLAKGNNATLCALSDLAVGLGIFFALGCGMIWLIDTVRFADGSALLDLEGLFEDLRHSPADQIWVLIMLGSTLLPTLLHAALGLTTVVLSHPEKLQKFISYLLHKGGEGYAPLGRLGQLLLSVVCASVVTLMGLMMYLITQFDHGWLLKHLIDIFEGFAQIIGAVSIVV